MTHTPPSVTEAPVASHRQTNARILPLLAPFIEAGRRILDLGSGAGYMTQKVAALLRDKQIDPGRHLLAMDLFGESYRCEGVPFQQADLNERLPLEADTFDAIYSIEVIEHLRRPYDFLAECHRVLKPGGLLVFSTPNTLHALSRLKQLFSGFSDLYVPPSIKPENGGRLCGHIMPLPYAYHVYGLRRAGFTHIEFVPDRIKRGAMAFAILLFPFFKLTSLLHQRRVRRYGADVYAENAAALETTNSFAMLSSRSCIITARKEKPHVA
ncbi:MAG: class I SAM-dependent methyltransferase [Pseudomonadota bacterium]